MFSTAVLLSGGIDSAFSAYCVGEHGKTRAVFVDYGQPARKMELLAATQLAESFRWPLYVVSISGMPLGQMADGVGAHVVPARNLWLISIAAAFGDRVWIGCAPQDERDYEDCRLHFLQNMNEAVRSIRRSVDWSNMPRSGRIAWLERRGVLGLCWSCYGPGPEPCGECASCRQ